MTERLINRTISRLYRQNLRFFALKLREYKLPIEAGQIPVLMQVYRNPGVTQDGISSNARLDKGTTARCLNQLEDAGLVRRETDENDRRINHIYATDDGMLIRGRVFDIISELHKILYDGFSKEEIDDANNMAERMISNMSECLKGMCGPDKV